MTKADKGAVEYRKNIEKQLSNRNISLLIETECAYSAGFKDAADLIFKWLEENMAKETSVLCCGVCNINFNNAFDKLKKYVFSEETGEKI